MPGRGCRSGRGRLHFAVEPPRPDPIIACIALGSNLGDRGGHVERAIGEIGSLEGVLVRRVSSIIETDPVGPPGQSRYLNAAVSVETTLTARGLLDALLGIERAHGRERRERWGPRTLDLDIILFGDEMIDEPELKIPHPGMRERRFVLAPLAEIEPDLVDPETGRRVLELLDEVGGVI